MAGVRIGTRGMVIGIAVCMGAGAIAWLYGQTIWQTVLRWELFLTDREKLQTAIKGFGRWAPMVFIAVQVLQVIFAPVPGEASGFLGGFLFGTFGGFAYSSAGLTIGSLVNFGIGRFLGDHYVRKRIPPHRLARMDAFIRHQGVIVLLFLFIFPGFPKDYLCIFLGATALPLKVFMIISTIGRMPGTFVLSLQGNSVSDGDYGLFAIVTGLSLAAGFISWHYREIIYTWVDRMNHGRGPRKGKDGDGPVRNCP